MTESERSVAVGPAAPDPPTNGHAGPPTAVTVVDVAADRGDRGRAGEPTQVKGLVAPEEAPARRRRGTRSPLIPPPPGRGSGAAPPRPPPRGRRSAARSSRPPRRRRRSRSRAAAEPARATPRAPLSEGDVRDVAEDFAQAYEAEDGAALRRVLTPGVQRVLPSGVARGRARVVNEYERQFRSQDTRGYELEDLEAHGGRVGRASGGYRVNREGGDAIEGRIVFGVVRDRGQPRIALIAVTPS